ncbi:MotA/TolQ/ExbB proton channel family protein [Paludibacterium yongneupense]|uniref:MotA/TolQ/ExbB proton channel family protein n=1 Tax=Paludibacterium yongneupense TaxID=400061 RepID=UPI00041D1F63|nr:MotA/TolQ/ExbB proton channel family protein [Paludibacterium yongneupense]
MTNTPYGLSQLWSQGDLAIRTVAVLLLLMSIASWYVIALHALRALRLRAAARASHGFWHASTFADGVARLEAAGDNPFHHLAEESRQAVQHHNDNKQDLHGQLSLAAWLSESQSGTLDECAERLQRGLSILASVGSTAPFVGLFGTVWGIYHALVGIGVAGQVGIDKIAGPVGEALIMTACGLVVAIPAVLGYNALTRINRRTIGSLQRFARQLHAYFLTGSAPAGSAARGDAQ